MSRYKRRRHVWFFDESAEKASRDDDVVVGLIVKCDDICLTHIFRD